ncbi:MAG: hypothetical protein WA672_11765 [Candidatus Angelobacter sp.]
MRLTSRLITADVLRAIESRDESAFPDEKASACGFFFGPTIQFRSGIGIGPVTVGAMVVETLAAIPVVTVKTLVKMVAAEILIANRTRSRRVSAANQTHTVVWKRVG